MPRLTDTENQDLAFLRQQPGYKVLIKHLEAQMKKCEKDADLALEEGNAVGVAIAYAQSKALKTMNHFMAGSQ